MEDKQADKGLKAKVRGLYKKIQAKGDNTHPLESAVTSKLLEDRNNRLSSPSKNVLDQNNGLANPSEVVQRTSVSDPTKNPVKGLVDISKASSQALSHYSTQSNEDAAREVSFIVRNDNREMGPSTLQEPTAVIRMPNKGLWDDAYRDILIHHPTIVRWYEAILYRDLGSKIHPFLDLSTRDRMKKLLDDWLHTEDPESEEDKSTSTSEEEGADEDDEKDETGDERQRKLSSIEHTPSSLRSIIKQSVERTSVDAVLLWAGVCHASKMLRNPSPKNKGHCKGLIFVISRIEWYSHLQRLLGETEVDADFLESGELPRRLVGLYTEILLYMMRLVCSQFSSLAFDFPNVIYQPRFGSATLAGIHAAEEALPLFNEHRVRMSLEKLLVDPRKEETQSSGESDSLLEALRGVDCDPKIFNVDDGEQSQTLPFYALIHSTEKYKEFLAKSEPEPHHQVFWVSVDGSQCKTMLLKGVVQAFSNPSSNEDTNVPFVSFFFFNYNQPESDNATAALRNLIWHILSRQPGLRHHLERKRARTARKYWTNSQDFPALSGLFLDIIQDEDFSLTYFVIDALDECSDYQRRLSGIGDMIGLIATSVRVNNKVRWIVSSNNSNKMKEMFQKVGLTDCWHLNLDDKADGDAIMGGYIRKRVTELADRKSYDPELEDTIFDKLCEHFRGRYCPVDIVYVILEEEDPWHAEELLDDMIKNATSSESLHQSMMEYQAQRFPRDKGHCLKILKIIAIVRQALTVDELEPLVDLAPRVDLRAILLRCSSFIHINDDDIVSFRHLLTWQYVQEHFLDRPSIINLHEELVCKCLQSLANSLGKSKIQGTKHYASLHWMIHLEEVINESISCDGVLAKTISWSNLYMEVLQFSNKHLLRWVYTLAINKQLSIALTRMQDVDLRFEDSLHSNPSREFEELRTLVRDIYQFLRLYYSTTAESVEVISAETTLLFCPTESIIRKTWIPKVLPWVVVPPKMERYWGPEFSCFQGHEDGVRSIAYSPDGRLIASGSDDSTICIWDAVSGTLQHKLDVSRRGWVYAVAFSSQGIVAAGCDDGTVVVWEGSTGRKITRLRIQYGSINSLCFSPDGNKLVATSTSNLWEWEVESVDFKKWSVGDQNTQESFRDLQAVVFSPDGELLVVGSGPGIHLLNARTGPKLRGTLRGDGESTRAAAFSRNGRLLATGSEKELAYLWDTLVITDTSTDHSPRLKLKHKSAVSSVAFSSDIKGSRLATAAGCAIYIWNTETGDMLQEVRQSASQITCLAFAPNIPVLALGSDDSTVRLWYASSKINNASVQSEQQSRDFTGRIADLTISSDGRTFAGIVGEGLVSMWDTQTNEILPFRMQSQAEIIAIAISPDGKLILLSDIDSKMRVFDIGTSRQLHSFKGEEWARGLAWCVCGSGMYFASASDDSSICIWKIGGPEYGGKPVKQWESAHGGAYATCVASGGPGGKYIVSGGNDKKIVVWERMGEGFEDDWEQKTVLTGHTDYVESVLLMKTASGLNRVVSASCDKTLRIWDIDKSMETQPSINIGWLDFYKIWLPPRSPQEVGSDYVVTPQGAIYLNHNSSVSSGASDASPWRIKFKPKGAKGWWITFKDRNVILLPDRRYQSCLVVGNKLFVASTEKLYTFEFSKDGPQSYKF